VRTTGMGWSELGPEEVSVDSRLADLEALLNGSGELGPYILVGHSLGSQFAWLHAQDHPNEVVGVVTVDGGSARILDILSFGDVSFGAPPPAFIIARLGLFPVVGRLRSGAPPPNMPTRSVEAITNRALLSEGMFEELQSNPKVMESTRRMSSLGDLPLMVITHGRAGGLMSMWGEKQEEAEVMWQDMQRALLAYSTDSTLLVAELSDHGIPYSQPEIIVQAIESLTEKYRATH
jgi:pimeloyl-ACP methyl ester carboxylesterase